MSEGPNSKSRIVCVVIALVLAALFLPGVSLPLLALGAMGIALIRSAVVHRNDGWIIGAIMGAILLIAGIGGAIGIIVLKWWGEY